MAQRIIIVAAPSCCGKTTFAKRLLRGELSEIAARCEFVETESWTFGDVWLKEEELLQQMDDPSLKIILHYTITDPLCRHLFNLKYDTKSRLSILTASSDITVLTLTADPSTLLHRVELRGKRHSELWAEGRISLFKYLRGLWGLHRLRRLYSSPTKLARAYRCWSSFLSGLGATQYAVDVTNDPRIRTSFEPTSYMRSAAP